MSFRKYTHAEIIGVKTASSKQRIASLDKVAGDWSDHDYKTDQDYLYVRVRAISSRSNLNHDSWPSDELAKSYRTFVGKPLFVEHQNGDPRRTRGVIVDAKLHQDDPKLSSLDPYYSSEDCWDCHKPPTWVELLLEVDAKTYPKFASAIISKEIDGFSMGANVAKSVCSHCGNEAEEPSQFCKHVSSKGAYFDYTDPSTGVKTSRRAVEHCYDFGFFELSGVVTPADPTALTVPDTIKHASTKEAFGSPAWFDAAVAAYIPALVAGGAVKGVWDKYRAKYGEQPAPEQEVAERVKSLGVYDGERGGYSTLAPSERMHASKTADRNDPPQYEAETAPDKIDTLRQQRTCPVCGSDGLEDGQCQVCFYSEPPEGFDNPDLEKAQQVDQEMRQNQGPVEVQEDGQPQQQMQSPAQDPNLVATSSSLTIEGVNDTERSVVANAGGPRGRVRVEELPALPAARKSSDKPKDAKVVKDHTKPVESSAEGITNTMSDTQKKQAAEPNGGADVAADARVDVEGVGAAIDTPAEAAETQNVEKDVNVKGPHTDTWSGMDGQTDAVTKSPFPASEDGVKASSTKEAGPKMPDHEPTRVDLHADVAEEVGDRTDTWSGTEGQADPVTSDTGDLIDVHKAAAAARKHALACIKLAEAEIGLGLTSEDDKYNRVSELEDATQAEIDAQLATLARVRTAGLRKQVPAKKTAATSLPSLQGRQAAVTPSEHAVPSSDQDISDAQAFM